MNKRHNKYKVTPDIHKFIENTSIRLGKFQRRDEKTGELMFRKIPVFKGQVPGKKNGTFVNNIEYKMEPIMVNHEVNLVAIYQKDGQVGMDSYIQFFEEILMDDMKQKIKDKKTPELTIVK